MVKGNKITLPQGRELILYAILALMLFSFIVLPLLSVVFKPRFADILNVLTSDVFRTAIFNTFILCIISSLFSTIVGYLYAYGIVYTNVPLKKIALLIPILHLVLPPSISSLSFILLLGRNGLITHSILNLNISLYGLPGIVIAQVLCFFPIAYIICLQYLKSINHSLENVAFSMGKNYFQIFFLTVRLSLPAILQSFLFVAVLVISDFGNPMVIAGRFRVLAVEIYTALTGWIDINRSSALGIFLLIPALILFYLQNVLERKNQKRKSHIGEKGHDYTIMLHSKPIDIFFSVFCHFISICILIQVVSLFIGSFQNIWNIDSSFTLKHILNIRNSFAEIRNSLSFAVISALLNVIIAICVAYLVNRTNYTFRKILSYIAQLPSAIPGTLYGLGFTICATLCNFRNSKLLIILAMVVGFLPFSYKFFYSNLSGISTSLDYASYSCGVNRLNTFRKIIFPLTSGSIFTSFLYSFVRGVGTMSAVIFLVSFDTPLVSLKILNLIEQGFWGDAAALSTFLILMIFLIMFVFFIFFKKITHSNKKIFSYL